MPQDTEQRRELMEQWFGSIDIAPPLGFLMARGWTEVAGLISKPTPSYNPSPYEVECLLFLRNEWDFDWDRPLYQPLPTDPKEGED